MDKLRVGVGILGGVLLIAGGLVAYRGSKDSERVEIITEGTEKTEGTEIIVDVAGAVERAGVYRLKAGARINEALIAAGGLAEEADRVWVARYVNLAQAVPDGAKIYIPATDGGGNNPINTNYQLSNERININTASANELDSLWGIGAKRAADIIANRPYQNTEELMAKAGIPKNVYERIREKITILP